jgi:cytochrome c
MRTIISAAVCAIALVSAPAFASKDLATAKGCLGCHAIEKAGALGPGYQAVAKKYEGQKDAEGKLTAYIRAGTPAGSKLMWGGMVPMPGNPALSEADAKKLAAWILAGAK